MRIAFIIPDCGEGGIFQFYNQIVPALGGDAELHVIFASPFGSAAHLPVAGATCHFLAAEGAAVARAELMRGPLGIFPHTAQMLAVAQRAWQTSLDLAPDVVEVCDWPLGCVPAVLGSTVPHVVQCHGSSAQIAARDRVIGSSSEATLQGLIESLALSSAHRVQSLSEANANFWQGATRRNVSMIRPAYPTKPTAPTKSAGGPIAVFGRLQSWKGPQVLCAALQRLGKQAPTCHWYGAAKPWPDSDLTADAFLADRFPDIWGRSFVHHGPLDRQTVARLQNESRCAIVPSTWDVFNFTAVEAMAMAKPVIVSRGAGASELISDGENGFSFDSGDDAALADCIQRFESMSPQQQRVMGLAGQETVRQELDPKRIAVQRLSAYQEAISSFAAGRPAANPWLQQLLSPAAPSSDALEAFCHTLPARPMLRSLAHRSWQKVANRSR